MEKKVDPWVEFSDAAPTDCPPGLRNLLDVDELVIKQQIELLEVFTGFETANKYKVSTFSCEFQNICHGAPSIAVF